MADVSHELGSLRLIVDSPLSSKVAMFNNQANQHQQAQLLNPFSGSDGRASPKPTFSKDQYGKPLAGSLTEMRGQKANIHVMREMLELCQIIDSEGYNVKDEPSMRVIPFGELFNIYNYISDKVVGILLRARKHKLVEFEGEMLFQRRDDNVPVFLLKPILEIRRELNAKMEDIKRASSPAPQATTLLMDKSAQRLKANSKSRTPTPASSKAPSPAPEAVPTPVAAAPPAVTVAVVPAAPIELPAEAVAVAEIEAKESEIKTEVSAPAEDIKPSQDALPKEAENEAPKLEETEAALESPAAPVPVETEATATDDNNNNNKATDINNNDADPAVASAASDLPVIIIEASAVHELGSAGAVEKEVDTTQEEITSAPSSAAETAAV